jgi:hypothetical protein
MINENNILQLVKAETEKLAFKTEFISELEKLDIPVLLVYPYSDDEDLNLRKWNFSLMVFPMGDDFDGSVLVQLFWEFNTVVNNLNSDAIHKFIVKNNIRLPLGYLGVSEETNRVHFRATIPIPVNAGLDYKYLADVYDLAMLPLTMFSEEMKSL